MSGKPKVSESFRIMECLQSTILPQLDIHFGHAMAQTVSHRLLTAEARVCPRVSPYGICGGQSGTGTGFSLSSLVFPGQQNSTEASYSCGINNRPVGGRSTNTVPHHRHEQGKKATYRVQALITTLIRIKLIVF
jgi:hypothetical protein